MVLMISPKVNSFRFFTFPESVVLPSTRIYPICPALVFIPLCTLKNLGFQLYQEIPKKERVPATELQGPEVHIGQEWQGLTQLTMKREYRTTVQGLQ